MYYYLSSSQTILCVNTGNWRQTIIYICAIIQLYTYIYNEIIFFVSISLFSLCLSLSFFLSLCLSLSLSRYYSLSLLRSNKRHEQGVASTCYFASLTYLQLAKHATSRFMYNLRRRSIYAQPVI